MVSQPSTRGEGVADLKERGDQAYILLLSHDFCKLIGHLDLQTSPAALLRTPLTRAQIR